MSWMTKSLSTFIVMWVISIIIMPTAVSAQDTVGESQNPANERAENQADLQVPGSRAMAQRQKLVANIWWNQTRKIEEIGLSEEQRAQMDASLKAYLESRAESLKKQREALSNFGTRLVQGEQEEVQQSGNELFELMSMPIRQQVDMMIDVAAMMTPEQRQQLVARYPMLFSRLWVRSSGLGRRRPGG